MGKIAIGCQTYTWEMLGDQWKGSVDDMLDIIAGAGYAGVEITNTMIAGYYDDPEGFARALDKRGLIFASFGFIPEHSYTDPALIDREIEYARRGIEFVRHFPECRLDLAGGSSPNRENLDEKFQAMCRIYNEVGAIADGKGVSVDFHPHSHAGSIIERAEEYQRVMECTDASIIGWCPDSGHIVRGGLDFIDTITRYGDRIRNFHFKDVDSQGNWKLMGEGICDFGKAFEMLEGMDYEGWVIAEEESGEARADQRDAVTRNRDYLQTLGY
jgi:sugar phosphate isomerase/epimerase